LELATPTSLPTQASETPPIIESPSAGTPAGTAAADCDQAQFIMDATYPDNSSVTANETITKTWQVKNTGSCTWDTAYRLAFIRGEQIGGNSALEVITDPVAPGDVVDLSIQLTAPFTNGSHWGIWQIHNAAGSPVLKADGTPQELSILINVTNGQGGTVASVRTWSYTFEGVKCTNNVQYEVKANIYTDGPVDVDFTWTVTNGTLSVVTGNHVFTGSGNLEVTTQITSPFTDPKNIVVTLTANGKSASFTLCP